MNTILQTLRKMRLGKNALIYLAMLIMALGLFYVLAFVFSPFEPLSIFPAKILLIFVGILTLMFMDKIHHSDINTTQAILSGNTAYGQVMIAYAIIIAAAILS